MSRYLAATCLTCASVTLVISAGQLLICSMRHAERQTAAVAPGERFLAVELVDELGDELLLGALQLGLGDAVLAQVVHDAVDALLDLVERNALGGNGRRRRCVPLSRFMPAYQPPALEAIFSSTTSF